MAEPEEDEEDNAAALEQLMAQAGRALQWQELEEQFCVLAELGSGTYGHVVLTEPRDGGEELWGLCPNAAPHACVMQEDIVCIGVACSQCAWEHTSQGGLHACNVNGGTLCIGVACSLSTWTQNLGADPLPPSQAHQWSSS